MNDRIVLSMVRGKTYLNVYHMGELIGKVEIADKNKSKNVSLRIHGDRTKTMFKIAKDSNESSPKVFSDDI